MLFHKLTDQDNTPLKLPLLHLNGNIIETENSLKFLGVIFDENLTWKKHIQLIEIKVSKNIGVLYETSKLINSKCLRRITSPLYTLTLTMQISHGLALIKLNLKNYLGNKTSCAYYI